MVKASERVCEVYGFSVGVGDLLAGNPVGNWGI